MVAKMDHERKETCCLTSLHGMDDFFEASFFLLASVSMIIRLFRDSRQVLHPAILSSWNKRPRIADKLMNMTTHNTEWVYRK